MESLRQIALKPSSELTSVSERCLPNEEYAELAVTVAGMARAYPNDMSESVEVLTRGMEMLGVMFGMKRLLRALTEMFIEPGRIFCPQPGEVRAKLEELMANERAQFLRDHPYTPCGECHDGMVITKREDGRFVAHECECKKAWRRSCEPAKSEPNYERARVQGQ